MQFKKAVEEYKEDHLCHILREIQRTSHEGCRVVGEREKRLYTKRRRLGGLVKKIQSQEECLLTLFFVKPFHTHGELTADT